MFWRHPQKYWSPSIAEKEMYWPFAMLKDITCESQEKSQKETIETREALRKMSLEETTEL